MLCVQRTSKDSFREAFNREVATVIGGAFGIMVMVFEKNVYRIPCEVLRYFLLSVLLIPIIDYSNAWEPPKIRSHSNAWEPSMNTRYGCSENVMN